MALTKGRLSNPQYSKNIKRWEKMRDCFDGEETVKEKSLSQNIQHLDGGTDLRPIRTFDQYIRPTDMMRRLGKLGIQRFCDYIFRAKYYPFPIETQSQCLGLIENRPASFDLPAKMEGLLEDATTENESLEKVLSQINTHQLQVSRVGLLLSPSNEENKPFNVALYTAESIVDWVEVTNADSDLQLDWVKLKTDETEGDKPVFLILGMDGERYFQFKTTNEAIDYQTDNALADGYIEDSFVYPMASERFINEIPFVIINVTKLGVDIERPFLESIVDASLSLYRASAHHEDALYWGGESTLFTKMYGVGENTQIFVGNGAINKSNSPDADAKYVTMGIDGIEPRYQNVIRLFEYCVSLSVDLLNNGNESGKALNIRSNVKTASLKTLSLTGALGLEFILRVGAKWIGLNPDDIKVKANTTFSDVQYTAEEFLKFASMVSLNTLSRNDLYVLLKKHNLTEVETFDEWNLQFDLTNENSSEPESNNP